MSADLTTMLVWSLFLLAGVVPTSHLYRHMGVIVASQASVVSLAALLDTLLLKGGVSPTLSWLAAVTGGAALGLAHIPILLRTRVSLLLILTAISQLALVEVWYALPRFTGGSSGVLLPPTGAGLPLAALVALLATYLAYLRRVVESADSNFNWACVKKLGPKAEAFGVPSLKLYAAAFVGYGLLLGASGVAATRLLGYLTVSSFGLGWALAAVMIALASQRHPVGAAVVLCLVYSAIRVLLRQSVYASVTASAIFEIMFPAVLLALLHVQNRFPRHDAAPHNANPSEA